MPFIDAGYDGTVDEVQFAKLLNRYAVVGSDDFKASAVAGADRTLSIANGTALGPGSLNVGSSFAPIQFEAVASGTTRWDLVVLRRDWQPPGGNTSIVIIKGGATAVLPARNQNPGVIDDQPLYLQQVNAGSTSLGTRIDLRVWVGSGGAEAANALALTYLAAPGAAVKIGSTVHRYELQGNGVWGWEAYYPYQVDGLPANRRPIIKTGNVQVATNAAGDAYYNFPEPFPNAMVSCVVIDTTDPTLWPSLTPKFVPGYSDRFRFGARIYTTSNGAALTSRTGLFVSFIAIGY